MDRQDSTRVAYRPFARRDERAVARLYARIWLAGEEDGCTCEASRLLASRYLAESTHGIVAEAGGTVVGVALLRVGGGARLGRDGEEVPTQPALARVMALDLDELRMAQDVWGTRALRETAQLTLLMVDPRTHGLGVGRGLVARARTMMRDAGATDFFLMTDDSCDTGFYDHMGLARQTMRTGSPSIHLYDGKVGTTPVGRLAPTPSGRMHLGNAFSALMAWLAARSQGGRMILRIEDLDPRARDPHAADLIMHDLDWLGLSWDEGPYYQSQRGDLYRSAIDRLASAGLTYPCFCTRSELHAASAPHASDGTYVYQGTCRHLTPQQVAERRRVRPGAVRLRVPDADDPTGTVALDDLCYGPREETLARDCGDFLVERSDGVVAYQLAVVVDDGLMGVTQVVRGNDLLGSSARQACLARLLGFAPPTFGHVPLLMSADGRRLSKRDRDLDLGALRAAGISPRCVVGRLAALAGLAEPGEEVRPDELTERFSWETLRAHRTNVTVGDTFLL